MAYHDDLLAQATHLVHLDRTRPRQVNLRRAISSAYYAVFHLLIAAASGHWRIKRQRSDLSRVFEHRKMKGLCNSLASPNPDLAMVAETFVDLQKKRHIADYDNATVWTRIQVEKFIEDAKVAFEAWARHQIPRRSPGFPPLPVRP